ncbi:MAG: cation-translocating P-type ATPase, partial [Turicibacter sp.]
MKYLKSVQTVLSELETNEFGLTQTEVQARLKASGYNELKAKKQVPIWKLILETLIDPLVIILLIAALVQMFLGETVESVIILLVIVLNSILSVTQMKKAEGSLESLKKLSTPIAKVIRDGKQFSITSNELVCGDIVLLEAGDYVPADGRIIESQSLKVVEGMLTGESEPVLKHHDVIAQEVGIGDQKNMVFSGSMVVYGRASVVICATGMATELGKVADLLQDAGEKQTPLQRKLEDFSKKLGIGIVILAIVIFTLQVIRGYGSGSANMEVIILDSFMFAIAIAVAAIPEALSSIVTIVLAVGTNNLAKKQAIVRKLPAVETLGSTSVICTDKTGTLTQNKMTVVDVFMQGTHNEELDFERINFSYHAKTLTLVSTLCNDSLINEEGNEVGDPTEVA